MLSKYQYHHKCHYRFSELTPLRVMGVDEKRERSLSAENRNGKGKGSKLKLTEYQGTEHKL